MFATDILKVLYAPHKVFKQIIQNPKYWGPLLIFILFVAVQSGFYYASNLKTNYEQTSPNTSNLGAWTENPGLWTTSAGVNVNSNYLDYLNSSLYGNSSLQFSVSNSNSLFMEMANFSNVDCGSLGFQNLSIRVEQVSPQATPNNVTLVLYSVNTANSYQYDLSPYFTNASLVGMWNNITIPVGVNATDWKSSGSPQWQNITGLKLIFNFSSASNITLRIEGLFFRGIYEPYTQISLSGFAINVLQLTISQFLFQWLILTGMLYLIIKGLKGEVVWKPLFVAVGSVLIVTVVQSLINIISTATLPIVNYPVEWYAGLPGESTVIASAIALQTQTFSIITSVVQLATYVWLVALGALVVRALVPEFSWTKNILASASALIVTIIIISLLGV